MKIRLGLELVISIAPHFVNVLLGYNAVMITATRSETILKCVSLGSASTFARSTLSTCVHPGMMQPLHSRYCTSFWLNGTPVRLNVVGARAGDRVTKMLTVVYRLVDVAQGAQLPIGMPLIAPDGAARRHNSLDDGYHCRGIALIHQFNVPLFGLWRRQRPSTVGCSVLYYTLPSPITITDSSVWITLPTPPRTNGVCISFQVQTSRKY